jgi:hypothetical protein
MRNVRARALALVAISMALGACREPDSAVAVVDPQAAHVREVVAAGGVVDSILPMAEQLRRFRSDLAPSPDSLRGASRSVNALVRRWALAVSERDTVALRRLSLDRSEFAWFYYPGSQLSRPPYESPPQLLWGQLQSNSESGIRQVLGRFGGSPFELIAVTCPPPSDTTTTSRVYSNCRVRVRISDRSTIEDRLFGSIVEHDGRFKFLGYANRL